MSLSGEGHKPNGKHFQMTVLKLIRIRQVHGLPFYKI